MGLIDGLSTEAASEALRQANGNVEQAAETIKRQRLETNSDSKKDNSTKRYLAHYLIVLKLICILESWSNSNIKFKCREQFTKARNYFGGCASLQRDANEPGDSKVYITRAIIIHKHQFKENIMHSLDSWEHLFLKYH